MDQQRSISITDLVERVRRLAAESAALAVDIEHVRAELERQPERFIQPQLLTVEEAAEALGVGRTIAWQLVSSGRLESAPIGRLRRVPLRAIDAFIASLMEESA